MTQHEFDAQLALWVERWKRENPDWKYIGSLNPFDAAEAARGATE